MKQKVPTGAVFFPTITLDSIIVPPADTNVSPTRKQRVRVFDAEVGNSSAANASCGWGFVVPTTMYKFGNWDNSAGASLTDDTTDAQSATANDVALFTVSENDDGHVIQSSHPFNIVQYVVSVANNGAGTIAFTYWNGSAWTSFTPMTTPDFANVATTYLVFGIPLGNWVPFAAADTPVATDGCTAGMYGIKVAATTAPVTTAARATSVKLVRLLDYLEIVGDGQSMIKSYGDTGIVVPNGATVTAYCSAANAANWCNFNFTIEA